jgi:hypothetical protein
MSDYRQGLASRRMELRTPEEVQLRNEGQINDHPDQRAEYPRMLYRKTDVKQYQPWADELHTGSEERMVINSFDGLLCDTVIVDDADSAETLAAEGWDVTPRAAYGLMDGLAKAATAKDERIAELERQLAESIKLADAEPVKRGPGRPPRTDTQDT